MGTATRFVPSASLSSMPPFWQRPAALPLSKSPLSIPLLPRRRSYFSSSSVRDRKSCLFYGDVGRERMVNREAKRKGEKENGREAILYTMNPYPILLLAALPGGQFQFKTLRSYLNLLQQNFLFYEMLYFCFDLITIWFRVSDRMHPPNCRVLAKCTS
ncbi:hypothetical protein KSP39_PZI014648 [Platanthera zijinensis]|uniref:Uncharacterized protein n=1 Tax=Platanthera zijinensis TaxID=2320716 RepID=A0AAP0BAL1_9ASPA